MVSCQFDSLTKYLYAALCARFCAALARCRPRRDYGFTGVLWSAQHRVAGNIRLKNATGEWRVVVSPWGRIRLCERDDTQGCR